VPIAEITTAFQQRTLEIDCVEMVLTQSASANPIVHKGKGYIRQDTNDVLTFKIYATETRNLTPFDSFKSSLGATAGQLFSPSDFFDLSATSNEGTVWHAERIIPRYNWTVGHDPIVLGNIGLLYIAQSLAESRHFVQIHFFDHVDLPHTLATKSEIDGHVTVNRDTSKFVAVGADFVVRTRNGAVVVEATSDNAMNGEIHTRIQEALAFLTAKPLSWRVLIRRDGHNQRIELSSATPKSPTTRLDPPVSPGYQGFLEHGWRLFSLYLDYIIKVTPHPYWNHCSYHLHNACEASANSIDAWAVGVSVALEGIATLINVERTDKERDTVAKLRCWVLKQLASHEEFLHLQKRLSGLLGMLDNDRVQDRLAPLVASGHVRDEHLRAWSRLRNRHVHPKVIDLRNAANRDFQELFDLINKTTVLMYHVVFYLIGYEGPYTDYGTHRYPPGNYPTVSGPSDAKSTSE